MRIREIKATPVNIPLVTPFIFGVGTYPGDSKTIVEIFTDEGPVGIGEASTPECAPYINSVLGPALRGKSPLDIQACERACVPDTQVMPNTGDSLALRSFGGIEIGLWDLRGKAAGMPLYLLLGGAARKEIPFTEYFSFRQKTGAVGGETTAEEVAAYCAEMRDRYGSTYFEGKLQLGLPELEVATVKAIRQAVGDDAMLRLDANMSWSLPTARRILAEIAPYNVRNYEDPAASFEAMAKLRMHSAISFSTHTIDFAKAIRLGVPDAFVTNLSVLGGLSRTQRFISACETAGIAWWPFSGETGVGMAAYLHLVAATPWVTEPGQCILHWQTDDVLEEGPFCPRNNVVRVPEGLGLGVTLSQAALKRCHERYLREGPYNFFRDPADPGRYRRLPLN